MGIQNQMHYDALEPAQCTAAVDSACPATCQAHENNHYRELAGRVTRAMILDDAFLAVLRKDQLSLEQRDILEKAVQVSRSLKKTHPLEAEP